MNPRLYRSTDDRFIAGVAGGMADYFNVDPVIVRILWVISVPLTGSLTFWIYLIMIVVVPLEPSEWPQPSPWAPGGTPLGYNASYAQSGTTPPAGTAAGTPAEGAASPDAAGFAATSTGPAPAQDGAAVPPPFGAPVPPPAGGPVDWRWQRRQDRWQRRAERWQQRTGDWDRHERSGSGGLVFGLFLIVVGGLVAWHEINPNLDLSLSWPIAIIAFGAILVVSSLGWRRGGGGGK